MDFNLNVNVQIGVTPQLATFLTALLQSRAATPVQLPATETTPPEPAESDKPRRTKADAPETAAPVTTTEEVPEAERQAETPQKVEATQSEKTTGEMIREIMHRTRQRIEGEDYKENAESEAYKKYHRQLTNQFKQIALILGYEKPSYIDVPEKVEAFSAECDALIIDEKGFIAPPQHPTK